MDNNRQNLFNEYRKGAFIGCPEPISTATCPNLLKFETNFKDYPTFFSKFFSDYKRVEQLRANLVTLPNIPKLNEKEFYETYACDLVKRSNFDVTKWELAATEFCKVPEPIKKASSIEIIQKYSDSDIYPFTNGVPVSRPNGFGYYEKEYTDNGGRNGKLRYSAPDEKGFVDVTFWYEDRLRWQKKDKVSTLLESIKRKKIISETLTKDLKVISLLKLIRENHTQKKKTINRSFIFEQGSLSDAQAKADFESKKDVYFQDTNSRTKLLNWNNTDLLESIAQKIINLIRQGYKGLMFKYYKTVIELLTQITPDFPLLMSQRLDPTTY